MPRKYVHKLSEGQRAAIRRRNAAKNPKQNIVYSPKAMQYAVKLRFAQ